MSPIAFAFQQRDQQSWIEITHTKKSPDEKKKSVAAIAISVSAISIFALKIPEEINKSYADPPIRLSSGDDVL